MSLLFTSPNCGYSQEVRYLCGMIENITYKSSIINPDPDEKNEIDETKNFNEIMDGIEKILNKIKNTDNPDDLKVELKEEVKKYILGNETLPKFDELRKDLAKELQANQENPDQRRKDVNINNVYGLGTDYISEILEKNINIMYETITDKRTTVRIMPKLIGELITSIILLDGFEKSKEELKTLLEQVNKAKEIFEVLEEGNKQ